MLGAFFEHDFNVSFYTGRLRATSSLLPDNRPGFVDLSQYLVQPTSTPLLTWEHAKQFSGAVLLFYTKMLDQNFVFIRNRHDVSSFSTSQWIQLKKARNQISCSFAGSLRGIWLLWFILVFTIYFIIICTGVLQISVIKSISTVIYRIITFKLVSNRLLRKQLANVNI